MIKKIHYFWFGMNQIPDSLKQYILSWEKNCPGFEIKRWDESNFDVNINKFVKEAYLQKKWAFVSDYARFYVLYKEGGICLDTDVELIKPLDDLMDESFAGFESNDFVAPGLILYACSPGLEIIKEVIDLYDSMDFTPEKINSITSPQVFTSILKKHGLRTDNTFQHIFGMNVYPMDYFQPWGTDWNKKNYFTNNTRSIHHYDGTWMNTVEKDYYSLRYTYGQVIGKLLFSAKHPIEAVKKLFHIKRENK